MANDATRLPSSALDLLNAEDERDVQVLMRPPIPPTPLAPGARTFERPPGRMNATPPTQKVTAQCKAIVDGVERVFEAVVELPAGLWNATFNKD